jgi:hypothetical protein
VAGGLNHCFGCMHGGWVQRVRGPRLRAAIATLLVAMDLRGLAMMDVLYLAMGGPEPEPEPQQQREPEGGRPQPPSLPSSRQAAVASQVALTDASLQEERRETRHEATDTPDTVPPEAIKHRIDLARIGACILLRCRRAGCTWYPSFSQRDGYTLSWVPSDIA